MSECPLLVFTDLDGTILDHDNYRYDDAETAFRRLKALSVPLIPTTSKTRAEILQLRKELENNHPFIVENGAAVFIPKGYFDAQPSGTFELDGFWVKSFAMTRSKWQAYLSDLPEEMSAAFKSFDMLGTQGIMEATGLSRDNALLANERDFSEPLLWLGTDLQKQQFTALMIDKGIQVVEGGRFVHMSTGYDKAKALKWLHKIYIESHSRDYLSIVSGDGGNDVTMLEAADIPIIVKSPHKEPIAIKTDKKIYLTEEVGPKGWNQSVHQILDSLHN